MICGDIETKKISDWGKLYENYYTIRLQMSALATDCVKGILSSTDSFEKELKWDNMTESGIVYTIDESKQYGFAKSIMLDGDKILVKLLSNRIVEWDKIDAHNKILIAEQLEYLTENRL